jgi:hypothetical protein
MLARWAEVVKDGGAELASQGEQLLHRLAGEALGLDQLAAQLVGACAIDA